MLRKTALLTFALSGGMLTLLILLCMLAGFSEATAADPAAPAAELHVCPAGCDYDSIQGAVDAAQPGDTILIAAGVYNDVTTRNDIKQVAYITKSLTLRGGYSNDFVNWNPKTYTTTLDGIDQGRPLVVIDAGDVTIEGLRLINGNSTGMGSQAYDLPEGGCRPATGWMLAGKGGGICVESSTILISDTIISNNYATHSGSQHGHGGGIYTAASQVTVVNSAIQNNTGNPSWWGHGCGVYIYDGSVLVENSLIAGNMGQVVESGGIGLYWTTGTVRTSTIRDNDGSGIVFQGEQPIIIERNHLEDNHSRGMSWGGCNDCKGQVTLTRNMITGNYDGGLRVNSQGRGRVDNNVILDNGHTGADGGAVYLLTYISSPALVFRHNTLASNVGNSGVYAWSGASEWTNNIIANHAVGVDRQSSQNPSVKLYNTLFDGNTVPIQGTVVESGSVYGSAAFAADGYHLTEMSDALERGLATSVTEDYDGETRPRPAGTLPDIGADELGVKFLVPFQKVALSPSIVLNDADAQYMVTLEQPYLIRFANLGTADITQLVVTDTLPNELDPVSTWYYPDMVVEQEQAQNQVIWQLDGALAENQSGYINVVGRYKVPEPGVVVTNTAELQARFATGELMTGTQVVTSESPMIAPLILFPRNGELCPEDHSIQVTGVAQPNSTLNIYVDYKKQTEWPIGPSGRFTATLPLTLTESYSEIYAKVCLLDGRCSSSSEMVSVRLSDSFYCPQRSTWEGTVMAGPMKDKNVMYNFRDDSGEYSTTDWEMAGVYGFWRTRLNLYICRCPAWSGTIDYPSEVWVVADGVHYDPVSEAPPMAYFDINGAHGVELWAQCDDNKISSNGRILIDPDGFIFDVTKGFEMTVGVSDTVQVTNTIPGVTVTAYVSMPQWGGWVPWPAQLYNNQVNPQVTGEDGYYAFFTPPGKYYLEVDPIEAGGDASYQPWRSPVIDVITQIVHVNVPLTPWPEDLVAGMPGVSLLPDGPEPAVITVPVGSAVKWTSMMDPKTPLEDLAYYTENPLLQPRSGGTLDPLISTLGFDGGMLAPGANFYRQFDEPGEYPYTDGAGHDALVVVEENGYSIFLPLVIRQ